jgi:hypothetical protein
LHHVCRNDGRRQGIFQKRDGFLKGPLAGQQAPGPTDILSVATSTAIPSLFAFEKATTETTTQRVQISALNSTSTDILLKMTRPDTLESHSTQALVDSGATDCFLDWKYVKRYQIPTTKLDRSIPVYNVDGSSNNDGSITHKCEMKVQHKDHCEKLWFYITRIGNKEIILGHSWLKKHNPSIDWETNNITFDHCPSECGLMLPEKEDEPEEKKFVYHTQFSEHIMRFKNPELGTWDDVEAVPELRIYASSNVATEIEIELLKNKEPITFETAVPQQYHMYKKVFEDAGFQTLPQRKPWDHAIDIKGDVTPQKLTKAYPVSPSEDEAMRNFINENLANGRIRPSQSPWASGFFFVKKKDGKL